MNIENYVKYFTKWTVSTTTNTKDNFGGVTVGTEEKEIEGYLSKNMSSNGQYGEDIPTTRSNGVLFTKPDVSLLMGDILNERYQVIDDDKHPSHNEYKLKILEKWGA